MILAFALALAANAFVERCSTRSDNCYDKQAAITSRAGLCGTTVAFGAFTHTYPGPVTDPNQIVIVQDAAFFTVVPSQDATLAQLDCLKDTTVPSPLFVAPPIKKKH